MYNQVGSRNNDWVFPVVGTVLTIMLILGGLWAYPNYNLWAKEMKGRAALREATFSRQIAVEEAKANLESEKLNAQSEIERAKGLAEAMKIENGQLTDQYISYLWVKNINEKNGNEKIYIPTEAGMPVLEARTPSAE